MRCTFLVIFNKALVIWDHYSPLIFELFELEIPPTILNLSFLSMRDLSYNHLKEKIPTRTQLQTFDASRFIGNNLCGPQLPINCSSNDYFIMPTIISTIILIILSKNGAPQSTYQCQREIKLSVAAIKIQTAFRGYLVSIYLGHKILLRYLYRNKKKDI